MVLVQPQIRVYQNILKLSSHLSTKSPRITAMWLTDWDGWIEIDEQTIGPVND